MKISPCILLAAALAFASSALPIPDPSGDVFHQGIYGIGHFGGFIGRITREEAERTRLSSGRLDEGDLVAGAIPVAGQNGDLADSLEETFTSFTTVVVTVTQMFDGVAPPTPTPTEV